MCDTLCILSPEGTLFAKSSDRPAGELQLPAAFDARPPGGRLRTQYLEIEDEGAAPVLLSRPDWLWGAEHGVNGHGVAIGNEKVDTVSGVSTAPPALIGMDLVRLGLERAGSAEAALEVMVDLLGRHGQGGMADRTFEQAYDSSFLVADASTAWVLETAGRTWAAEPVPANGTAAISNRLTIGCGWSRASPDVPPGADFDAWRDPAVATGYADGRLAASRAFLRSGGDAAAPLPARARAVVAHLRDHGTGPWGGPGSDRSRSPGAARVVPPPSESRADGTGITVCMHVGGLMATTASWVVHLPRLGEAPIRSWVALGSPCVSVYVPLFGMARMPTGVVAAGLWHRGETLRQRIEADGSELERVRDVLAPLEAALWEEADDLVACPDRWARFHDDAWHRVAGAMSGLTGARVTGTRVTGDRMTGDRLTGTA